jgi:hypothetical protein
MTSPKNAEANNARGDGWRHPLRSTVIPPLLGAIVGSVLTFALPLVWNYLTAPPAPPTLPAPPTVLSVTPNQLMSWYKGINHPVQANTLAREMYYGKWVRWEGEVSYIDDYPSGQGTLGFGNFAISCSREQVSRIKIGDKLRVLGTLHTITKDVVWLDDCELEWIDEVLK